MCSDVSVPFLNDTPIHFPASTLPTYPPGLTNGQAGKSEKIKSRAGLQVITGGAGLTLAKTIKHPRAGKSYLLRIRRYREFQCPDDLVHLLEAKTADLSEIQLEPMQEDKYPIIILSMRLSGIGVFKCCCGY